MYNKLFQKILDSSVWLESDTTRIVWFTFLAAMDETGYAHFSSVANLAHRARVSLDACRRAVEVLEGPDEESADKDREGRRIERVDGGWLVINAPKYRDIVTRAVAKQKTRERVERFRERRRGNAPVTVANESVTQSDTDTDTDTEANTKAAAKEASSPLIKSPAYVHKRMRYCAFVGSRIEVPTALHAELRTALGGENAESVLQDWYLSLNDEAEVEGWSVPIGSDVFKWLKGHYQRRFPAQAAPARPAAPQATKQGATRNEAAVAQAMETRRRRAQMQAEGMDDEAIEAVFDREYQERLAGR